MTDDQQRARELLADWHRNKGCSQQVIDDCLSGVIAIPDFYMDLITAALRAAPEVPEVRVTEPLRADESRQEQADAAIYNRGWNECRVAMLAARPQGDVA